MDKNKIEQKDLVDIHIYQLNQIGKLKTEAIHAWIENQQTLTVVKIHKNELEDFEEPCSEYQIIIVCDIYDLDFLQKFDRFCQEKNKKWIFCGCIGNLGYSFFNFQYIKMNERFQENEIYPIEKITNSNPGVVILKTNHFFVRGDFIQFENLTGIKEISSEEIRPICKVLNSNSFEIENTELYSEYKGGGYVTGVNFPKNYKYTSFVQQINNPQFWSENQNTENFQKHFIFVANFLMMNKKEEFPKGNFDELFDSIHEKLQQFSFYQSSLKNQTLEELKQKTQLVWKWQQEDAFCLEKFIIGALVSSEICKINGKFRPFEQTLYIQTEIKMSQYEEILNKNIFIIGANGKTHEILKIFSSLCRINQKDMIIQLMDESQIQEASLPTNFYYKLKDKKINKAKVLSQRINSLQNKLLVKVVYKSNKLETAQMSDIILINLDNYNEINEYCETFIWLPANLLVLNNYGHKSQCLNITKDNKEYLENYFNKKNILNNLIQ